MCIGLLGPENSHIALAWCCSSAMQQATACARTRVVVSPAFTRTSIRSSTDSHPSFIFEADSHALRDGIPGTGSLRWLFFSV